MKNKIIISVFILLLALLCVITVLFCLTHDNSANVHTSTKGLYLSANGKSMIIVDESPIVMNDQTDNKDIFKGLTDGDVILISHGVFQESYPGATEIYSLEKLSDGNISDIPESVIQALSEMGWLKNTAFSDKKLPTVVEFTLGDGEYGICPADPRPEKEVKLIRSTDELKAHWDSVRNETILTDPTDEYNEEYFENNFLLLVYVFGQSGMTEYTVEGIVKDGDTVTVNLQSYTPALHTDDCYATWLFFELSKDVDILSREFVKVNINGLEAFSYSEFLNSVDRDTPGLQFDNFNNTKPCDATAKETAIDLAKKELSMGFTYDTVDVAFDRFHTMWSITFSTEGTAGGCTTVFLSTDGITQAILAGE